jgi:hypothetical protein
MGLVRRTAGPHVGVRTVAACLWGAAAGSGAACSCSILSVQRPAVEFCADVATVLDTDDLAVAQGVHTSVGSAMRTVAADCA